MTTRTQPLLCALCLRPIVGEPRLFEGYRICVACDEESAVAYDSDRRCEPSEGIGWGLKDKLTTAMERVIPERVRKLDADCDRGIPVGGPPDHGRAWWDDSLSPNQAEYARRSRNRGKRKDSL